jgi:hypothetical protein
MSENNAITVITNGHVRELISVEQVPVKEQHWFDYITGEDRYSTRIFAYRGSYYDVYEFTCAPTSFPTSWNGAGYWDGIQSDSFFSGLVIRWPVDSYCGTTDYQSVVVGRYFG